MTESHPLPSFVPERTFVEENLSSIEGVFGVLREQFPDANVPSELFLDERAFTLETMRWMWDNFMGGQHGNVIPGKKLPISSANEGPYWQYVNELHYGPYSFTEPRSIDTTVHYDRGFVLGGTPEGMAILLKNMIGSLGIEDMSRVFDGLFDGGVDDLFVMAGQRPRGWKVASEVSAQTVYDAVARETGTDMEELRRLSPWLRREQARADIDEWHGPLRTEESMALLVVEAALSRSSRFDWDDYPVTLTPAEGDLPVDFREDGKPSYVPDREHALTTYHLKGGNRVHVLNARAVNRPKGPPRPTSVSQIKEILALHPPDANAATSVAISVAGPHVRAGLELVTNLHMQARDKGGLGDVALAVSPWLPHADIITALGELPATYKADEGLREAFSGGDPSRPAFAGRFQ